VLAANKAEGLSAERAAAEFYELGLGEPHPISSAHGDNVTALIDIALGDVPGALGVAAPDETLSGALGVAAPDETLPRALGVGAPDQTLPGALLGTAPEETTPGDHLGTAPDETTPTAPLPEDGMPTKVAIVGRPNVGKSTLVNTLLGEERVIAFNEPGTTRDSIYLDFERSGRRYTLIDTAGVRRRGKVADVIEKFSVIKTLQAIEDAHVVVLLLDAQHEVTEQDAHLAGYILDAGRALVVGINKWDGLAADRRDDVKREFGRKLAFLAFAHHHYLSAKDGRGVGELMRSVDAAYAAAMARLPTPKLTRALQQAVERQQPPRAGMGRPKLRYAHQGGQNPPLIIIHGSALAHIPDSYRRYLEHFFTDAFQLRGTPLRIQFKTGANPYANLPARRTGRKGRRPGFPVG
jgi:GTP-binding protein